MKLSIQDIIQIDFSAFFQEMKRARVQVHKYLDEIDIPKIIAFSIPEDKVVQLAIMLNRPELNAWEATQYITTLKPDVIMTVSLPCMFDPKSTKIYYYMRLYLHELLTSQYDNENTKKTINQNIKQTRKAIKNLLDNYPAVLDSIDIGGQVCLFKGAFIYRVDIGPSDWFTESNEQLYRLVEQENEVNQYNFDEYLDSISEDVIDVFLNHDEIMIATNSDTRSELAKKIYMKSAFQDIYPIKRSYYSHNLGNLLQTAQSIYEIEILPQKIRTLMDKGFTQKKIAEDTNVSATKISNIVKAFKLKSIK